MELSEAELCDRYEQLYPGAVTDTLDQMGYENQTLLSEINPLTMDTTMAGVAYPVRGRPDPKTDYDENIRRFLKMLGDAPEDSIIAYETNDEEAAHLGELSTAALEAGGCRGAVINGGVRDVSKILEQEFPVFTRYRTPADAPPRWRLEEWDIPVTVGDVEIRPGDILIGDVDGVVCVPRSVAAEVLERAEETVTTENEVRKAVKDGADPLEAYEQFGKF